MTVRGGDLVHRVARRISEARARLGITQEALAVALDMATKNLQRIESGRQNLTLTSIEKIALALRIEPEMLLRTRPVSKQKSPTSTILEALARAGYATRPATKSGRRPTSAMPVMNLRAAAGSLKGARAVEVLGWVTLAKRRVASGTFVARVEGDSMEPQIPDGAFVVFRRTRQRPVRGKIYLFEHATLADSELGGPYVVKKMGPEKKLPSGVTRVALESNNRNVPPIVLQLDDVDELRVIAELIEVLRQR